MEVFKTHVAGVDVHKEVLAITVVIGEPDSKPQETQFACLTFTEDLIKAGLNEPRFLKSIRKAKRYDKLNWPRRSSPARPRDSRWRRVRSAF